MICVFSLYAFQLLRQENLDLKLTPYRVLATSSKNGFVQFIDSLPVADVLSQEGNIQVNASFCQLALVVLVKILGCHMKIGFL